MARISARPTSNIGGISLESDVGITSTFGRSDESNARALCDYSHRQKAWVEVPLYACISKLIVGTILANIHSDRCCRPT